MKLLEAISLAPGTGVSLGLPGSQISEIVRAAGTVLVMQGNRLGEVLVVRDGTILVTRYTAEGDEIWSSVRGHDTLIGAEALRTGRSQVEVTALTEVRLLRIAAEDFRAWVGPADTPAARLIEFLLEEIAAHRRDRAMASGPAVSRIARFLRDRQKLESAGRPFDIEQKVLARVLQIRPETLSRALTQLRQDGILARGSRLQVLDVHRLSRLADASDEIMLKPSKTPPNGIQPASDAGSADDELSRAS